MEYYVADIHFCHKNIPKFEPTRTQFIDNVDLMNETIIQNWNAVVMNEDIVNIIGDVGIGAQASIVECVKRLNGKLRLWPGNHDHGNLLKKLQSEAGVEVMPYMTKIKTHGVVVFVTHYPMDIGERPNLFNIHGHIHSEPSRLCNQINVGVDQDWGLPFGQPIPKEMVEERIIKLSKFIREIRETSINRSEHPAKVFINTFKNTEEHLYEKLSTRIGQKQKNDAIKLLWLWYDYKTEMYDRLFPHVIVGEHKRARIIYRPHRVLSGKNARQKMKTIDQSALLLGVTIDDLYKGRNTNDTPRSFDKVIEEYKYAVEHEPELIGMLEKSGIMFD